jgi:hypothetical protein
VLSGCVGRLGGWTADRNQLAGRQALMQPWAHRREQRGRNAPKVAALVAAGGSGDPRIVRHVAVLLVAQAASVRLGSGRRQRGTHPRQHRPHHALRYQPLDHL